MASLERDDQLSLKRPFIIATDEGKLTSDEIIGVCPGGYEDQTYLFRKDGKTTAYVEAPCAVVAKIFRDHGYDDIAYDFYGSEELEQLTTEYKESRKRGPSPD